MQLWIMRDTCHFMIIIVYGNYKVTEKVFLYPKMSFGWQLNDCIIKLLFLKCHRLALILCLKNGKNVFKRLKLSKSEVNSWTLFWKILVLWSARHMLTKM